MDGVPIDIIPLPEEPSDKSKQIKTKLQEEININNGEVARLDKESTDNGKDVNTHHPSQSIVDELFKDFLAQKNAQIKTTSVVVAPTKSFEHASIDEINALLDHEINLIKTQKSDDSKDDSHRKKKHKKKRKSETSDDVRESRHSKHKKKKREHREDKDNTRYLSNNDDTTHLSSVKDDGSRLSIDSDKSKNNDLSELSISATKLSEIKKSKSGLELLSQYSEVNEDKSDTTGIIGKTVEIKNLTGENTNNTTNTEVSDDNKQSSVSIQSSVFEKPVRKTKDLLEGDKDELLSAPVIKSKPVINKSGNISLKITNNSAQFIASGEVYDKKGKRREEGEVISSGSDDNSNSNDDEDDDEDEEEGSKMSETGSLPETDDEKNGVKKKKKKHKHKHKKKKKHKNKDKDKDKEKDKSEKKKNKRSRSREGSREKSESYKTRKRDRSRSRSHSRSTSKTRHPSNEVFDRGWDARSYMNDVKGERSTYRKNDRYKRSSKYSRSRSRTRSRSRSHSRSKTRRRRRSRSRSRSRSRPRKKETSSDLRLQIDKKKLRKIAIANALANLKGGNVNSADIASLKSGGKSVEELTDFCKGLVGKDHLFSSSDSESNVSHSDNEQDQPFIHHPFKVKEAAPIIMNIRNMKQIPIMTQSEKTVSVLRSQFPVSSGNQHRLKELEWVPVEKSTTPTLPALETAVARTTSAAATTTSADPSATATDTSIPILPAAETSTQPEPVVADPVFPQPVALPIDIGAIVSERLQAVRKLQENPYDVQALSKMHHSQEKASRWAQSQYQPGQFTGSTGVQILTKQELEGSNKKNQAWLKKDQFKRAEPVKSGIGMFLLQKMGWRAGEGLGKNNEGSLEPLLLDLKVDRKGLQTQSEVKPYQRGFGKMNRGNRGGGGHGGPSAAGGGGGGQTLPKDLSGKHPVSALLELCNRRKYGAPYFEMIHESGPDHKKNFLFKVLVNRVEYQPSIASNNKKTAKAQAATVCLQELGMVPRQGPI